MESVRQPGSSGEIPDSLLIFGLDIFDGENLTFEPNENLATPETYQLGPGDQLLIEIFGYSEGSYNKTISPEGTINISQIGRVQLGGLTIKEAREKLRRALVSKYASVGGSNPNSTVSITLSNIRTIQVNVMGEVEMPGTFRLSPFATVFNALYNAGGVTENGSMRAIKVIRSGEQIATVDVYGYLFNGRSDSDITLKEGDVVIVPPYVNLVRAGGNVKRPMFYELAEGETLSDLVQYAGGYSSKAHQDDIRVIRQLGAERQIYTVKQPDVAGFAMADGDEVYVEATMERFSNKVEIKGAVFRPGMYEYGGGIATVRQLIDAAGGLKEDAFTGRAVLVREKEDLTFESRSVDLAGILAGRADDILLRKNDILTISSNKDLSDPGTLTINGYVQNPGVFPFVANTTVEDLILLAGGLLDGASLSRVDIARRVSDPYSQMPSDTVGQTFTFALREGLLEKEGERFVLEPYDVVSVRRSPSFRTQKFVSVTGEVPFPGDFVLLSEGERVSELVKRAGGATNHAFLKGATLTRRLTDEERVMQIAKLQMLSGAAASRDSLDLDQIRVGDTYSVGVELDKALARPGSEYDLILREGDHIFVPEQLSTVRISGAVMYPNTAIYVPGKGVEHYINAAGGYGARARRSRVYIVYMNGRVQKAGAGGKVEPGCEIIVPERPERRGMTTGEVMSMASSAASLTTVVITLVNLLKK
ncbi:MAG: capsule biosynthesis protein [Bacteroidales bacterium]|nr:capsule biosynthesis protein [Bacteroidales bacterium]